MSRDNREGISRISPLFSDFVSLQLFLSLLESCQLMLLNKTVPTPLLLLPHSLSREGGPARNCRASPRRLETFKKVNAVDAATRFKASEMETVDLEIIVHKIIKRLNSKLRIIKFGAVNSSL